MPEKQRVLCYTIQHKLRLSDPTLSYSDECRRKKAFVCEENVAAFSCCGKVL